MKILHCADLHLDSKMTSNLDKDKAKQRQGEILHTFERMVQYAADCGIGIILISGDLFDKKNISATARNMVVSIINRYREIGFYYLKGNHDQDNFLAGVEEIPENLYTFTDSWTKYEVGNVTIAGIELDEKNASYAYNSLVLDYDRFNIVMLHGQESESASKDKAEIINLNELKGKNIDYLALGHVHARKVVSLDKRTTMCYPGCLEGRGFDECGDHGFAVIDVDPERGTLTHEFIDFAYRKLYWIDVDVTGCDTTAMMEERVDAELEYAGCEDESLIKIVLTGAVDVDCEKNPDYIQARYGSRFFYVKVEDKTALKVDIKDYIHDESLKGEFVRLVMGEDSISEEDKAEIIRYGLLALSGEEVQL